MTNKQRLLNDLKARTEDTESVFIYIMKKIFMALMTIVAPVIGGILVYAICGLAWYIIGLIMIALISPIHPK